MSLKFKLIVGGIIASMLPLEAIVGYFAISRSPGIDLPCQQPGP